jgi:RND family efflux transporter MFP subunit
VQQRIPNIYYRHNLLLTIILLLSFLVISGCGKEEVAEETVVIRPVKTITVQASNDIMQRNLPGTVRAAKRSELSFEVSGPLVELPIEEGLHVKKGDLIAQIQQRDFLTAVDEAKARNLEAEKQFNRYKELYARKQVSQADYDSYRAARDVARAQLEDAQNRLQDTTLTAPFSGIISKRFVENHQKIQAKEAIANLQDITRIEILVDVPELMMAALKENQQTDIKATFEAIPGKSYPLSIREYSTQADPTTQTYQTVLIMDQPDEAEILPGMTAMVEANMANDANTASSAILIPAIAVMNGAGNETFVWLLEKNQKTVHKQQVSVGRLDGDKNISIREGLHGGETVITAGLTQLEEGMQVRPWEQQREGK